MMQNSVASLLRLPGSSNGQDIPDTYRGELGSISGRDQHDEDLECDTVNHSNVADSAVEHSRRSQSHVTEIQSSPRLQPPKHPEYVPKSKRMISYRTWPSASQQRPENLAEAGFFYTGSSDSVRCFQCGTGLRNWDPEDEPWVEHARWAPECYHVRDKKGQDFINLVQVAVRQQQMQEALQQQTDELTPHTSDLAADCVQPNTNTTDSVTPSCSQPSKRQPTNAEKKNPLLSDAAQSVLAMGYLPKIVKLAVDQVLQSKGWDGMSGSNIANVIFDMEEAGEIDTNRCMVPKVLSDSSKKEILELVPSEKKDIMQKNGEMKERTLCILCCEERVSIVFLPCGHLVSCAQCSPALKNCPVCREGIKGTVRVSFT